MGENTLKYDQMHISKAEIKAVAYWGFSKWGKLMGIGENDVW